MFRHMKLWLGIGLTVVLLVGFFWKVDHVEIAAQFAKADYSLYLPAVLLYFVALGIRAYRWKYLLAHLKVVGISRLYPIVSIAYMANNVLPMRMGELVRAHFLGEKEGLSKTSVLASVGLERVLDGIVLIVMVLIIWPILPWTDVLKGGYGQLNTTWIFATVCIVVAFITVFVLLIVVTYLPTLSRNIILGPVSIFPSGLRIKIENIVDLLIDGVGSLRDPKRFLWIGLISFPVWLVEAYMYYLISISFDLGLSFQIILLVTAVSNLATAIPSSMGGIGPFEVVAKVTLVTFGIGSEAATAYAFFVHIIALWIPVNILGLFFLWKENISFITFVRRRFNDQNYKA